MPVRNRKYRYAIEKEMEWLEEDIRICLEQIEKENDHRREIELRLRHIWADNERCRLNMWMEESRKCQKSKAQSTTSKQP